MQLSQPPKPTYVAPPTCGLQPLTIRHPQQLGSATGFSAQVYVWTRSCLRFDDETFPYEQIPEEWPPINLSSTARCCRWTSSRGLDPLLANLLCSCWNHQRAANVMHVGGCLEFYQTDMTLT